MSVIENAEKINNPYAPPVVEMVESVAIRPPAYEYFRPTTVFAWFAMVLIGSSTLAESILELVTIDVSNAVMIQLFAVATLFLLLAGVVIFCIWLYRSAKNAIYFSGNTLSHSPGLAVGYYFIPFACWVKPISSMSEIYDKTYALYQVKRPVALLRIWWAAWVSAQLLSRLHNMVGSESGVNYLLITARLIACIGVILVIHTLTKRQHGIMSSPELIEKIGRNTFINTFPRTVGIPMKKAAIPPRRDEATDEN